MSKNKMARNDSEFILRTDFHSVSQEQFEQILDEWAEIVYRSFSQFREKESLVTETSKPFEAERTGTNG